MHLLFPMAGNNNISNFCDMTPFRLADSHKHFEVTFSLQLQGKVIILWGKEITWCKDRCTGIV